MLDLLLDYANHTVEFIHEPMMQLARSNVHAWEYVSVDYQPYLDTKMIWRMNTNMDSLPRPQSNVFVTVPRTNVRQSSVFCL